MSARLAGNGSAVLLEGDHFLRWLAIGLALAMLAGVGCRTVNDQTMEGAVQPASTHEQRTHADAQAGLRDAGPSDLDAFESFLRE